jgi:L-amino acid N-acyltransferase YncA
MATTIRPMVEADGPAVLAIYQAGIAGGEATFEEHAPDWPTWSAAHHAHSRIVADSAERNGIWTLQSSIFEENAASARLHARHRFRVVGRRERIGLMRFGPRKGLWRDTILLERRSENVGTS